MPLRRLVTCGEEGEVKTYHNLPESQDDDPIEFDLSTSRVSAMTCYLTPGGLDVIAVAMDDNTIQAFSTEVIICFWMEKKFLSFDFRVTLKDY